MNDGYAYYALFAGLAVFWLIVVIAFYVISAWFLMKIFDKAGVQGRWRAWVPVYNAMVFMKLGDLSPWLILYAIGASIVISVIPILGSVLGWLLWIATLLLSALAAWRVGLKLQKEPVWLVLYILVSIVWLGINAFDKSRWNIAIPAAPWAGNSFLADRTVWEGIPSQAPVGGYPAAGAAPGAYPPPAGYQQPPAGYQPPPAGYQAPPPGYQPPPAGYQAPPPGYQPPPAAQPPITQPPAAQPPAGQPPVTPPAPQDPPATPPAAPEPPAAPQPPTGPDAPER